MWPDLLVPSGFPARTPPARILSALASALGPAAAVQPTALASAGTGSCVVERYCGKASLPCSHDLSSIQEGPPGLSGDRIPQLYKQYST